MPRRGLEPPRVASHVPETCVSTNFTTSARVAEGERIPNQQPIILIANPAVVNTLVMPDDEPLKIGLGILNDAFKAFKTSHT